MGQCGGSHDKGIHDDDLVDNRPVSILDNGDYQGTLFYPDPTSGPQLVEGTLLTELLGAHQRGEKVALLIIDMSEDLPRMAGFGRGDSADAQSIFDAVSQAQIHLIEAATAAGIPVFEIWLQRKSDDEKSNTHPHFKVALPHGGPQIVIGKPKFNAFDKGGLGEETSLGKELADRGITKAVVGGFCGNLCVKQTIFGNDLMGVDKDSNSVKIGRVPGLLERGISVLTSRTVLFTNNNAPLDGAYGVRGLSSSTSSSSGSPSGNHNPDTVKRQKSGRKHKSGKLHKNNNHHHK